MGKDDDLALWRKVAETVTPLRRGKPHFAKRPAEAEAKAKEAETDRRPAPKAKAPRRPIPTPPGAAAPPAPARAPVLAHGQTAGVDARTAARLRRGKLPIDATLDLHGHRQEEAHRALIRFVTAHHAAGRRCLLIVTGKGLRRGAADDATRGGLWNGGWGGGWDGDADSGWGAAGTHGGAPGPGVLRRQVPLWLNAPPLRDKVLAFDYARQQHGGSGALYVLLKRKRD